MDGQEARKWGHLQGFPGYLTLYGCFITIYLFTPLKSRQKRFCYHLDLPIHKTHGFAYHILLYLTYFRFCILGVLQQKLDHLQFSEVQNMLPPQWEWRLNCCHLCHPMFASRGSKIENSSVEPVSHGGKRPFTLLPDFSPFLSGSFVSFLGFTQILNKDLWFQNKD